MSPFDIWLGILQGLGTTASVTAYGLVFAVPFALVFGVAQYLARGVARLLITGVIEFWRSSAVIILLFVFYYVLPVVGIATGIGPLLGVVIGTIAMTCDVFTIRRFFEVDHRWRWQVSAIAVCVIGLLTVLLVEDIAHLVTNGPFS